MWTLSNVGLLMGLSGLFLQTLSLVASGSQRLRMALPLPVESSPTWLIVIGLVCEVVGCLLTAF